MSTSLWLFQNFRLKRNTTKLNPSMFKALQSDSNISNVDLKGQIIQLYNRLDKFL